VSRLAAIKRGRSLVVKISGEGVIPGEYFLVSTKLDTFCYMTVQTAQCKLHRVTLRAVVLTLYQRVTDGQTDGWTDGQTVGIAVASTALTMPALRRAVKSVICDVFDSI